MPADMRDLERHGNQLRAQRVVPKRLRPIIGKSKLVQGLKTDSVARAHLLKRPILADFDRIIAEAEKRLRLASDPSASPLMAEALEAHSELGKAEADPMASAVRDEDGAVIVSGPAWVRNMIDSRAMELEAKGQREEAALYHGVASGTATPLLSLVDDYLTEAKMKPRQEGSYRTALRKLEAWLQDTNRQTTLEVVTPKVAGQYAGTFIKARAHGKTANKDISACSSYWRWLVKRGHIDANPWKDQSLAKKSTPKDQQKRPFTDAEMLTLLNGGASSLLLDFMTIAALTGMRINEIACLEARDIHDGLITIRKSKTEAGERVIPVHPSLLPLFARRMEGRIGTIFPDLREVPGGSTVERSMPVSKEFTRYRRKLKVDEIGEGARQSNVDFHSFRRWFARKAMTAFHDGMLGFGESTIALILGHKTENKEHGMTMRYAGHDPMKARRACVEAVRLPEG